MRFVAFVVGVVLVVPAAAGAEVVNLRAAVESAAVEAGVAAGVAAQGGQQLRQRSMARTWGGVALIGVGLLMPAQQETCLTLFGAEAGCVTELYAPGIAAGVGLIGTGVLLATVWSDVPVRPSIDFTVAPDRVEVGKTFGF